MVEILDIKELRSSEMNTKEKIEVMQAHVDGIDTEISIDEGESWNPLLITTPSWNWYQYQYRIKPKEEKIITITFSDGSKLLLNEADATISCENIWKDEVVEYANMGVVRDKKLDRVEYTIKVSGFVYDEVLKDE